MGVCALRCGSLYQRHVPGLNDGDLYKYQGFNRWLPRLACLFQTRWCSHCVAGIVWICFWKGTKLLICVQVSPLNKRLNSEASPQLMVWGKATNKKAADISFRALSCLTKVFVHYNGAVNVWWLPSHCGDGGAFLYQLTFQKDSVKNTSCLLVGKLEWDIVLVRVPTKWNFFVFLYY